MEEVKFFGAQEKHLNLVLVFIEAKALSDVIFDALLHIRGVRVQSPRNTLVSLAERSRGDN